MGSAENTGWNDAIDEVLELMRIHPPHRIGEAAFMRRLMGLKSGNERKSNYSNSGKYAIASAKSINKSGRS